MATTLQPDLKSIVNRFVSQYASKYQNTLTRSTGSTREDIRLFMDMSRRDPVTRFCIELVFLYTYSLIGDYTHKRPRVEKDVRAAIANCKGSWSIQFKQMLTAAWYGYSWTEIAAADLPNGRKTLSKLRTLNPSLYDFRGTEEGVDQVWYSGRNGTLELDYNTGVHLVIGSDLSFDDNYGCGRLEAAYPYWDLWQLLAPVIAVAAQRQATPIIIAKTRVESSVPVLGEGGDQVLNSDGTPKLTTKGVQMRDQIVSMDGAGVLVVHLEDEVVAIEQKVAGDFLMAVAQMCEQYRIVACLVPVTTFSISGNGVGDSGLSERHQKVFESINAGLAGFVCEELIEQLIRPLIIYNFGDIGDYGEFPINRSDAAALEVSKIISDAIARGAFSKKDLEVANTLRGKLGMGALTEDEFGAMQNDGDQTVPEGVDRIAG